MARDEVLLTQEGYDKLVAEHEELVSVRRLEVAERLKEAIFLKTRNMMRRRTNRRNWKKRS